MKAYRPADDMLASKEKLVQMRLINKKIILMSLLLAPVINLSAQQKALKKPVPKPAVKKVPPPPKVMEPVVREVNVSSGEGIYPTISISPQEAKYDRDKICTDCDTLILAPGKTHIVVYNVYWMGSRESRTYNKQPKESDPMHSRYALQGTAKREWDELQRNFPESEVSYHYVYRNTYIKVPNASNEILDLLDRQQRYEGLLYWSGKTTDKTFQQKKMVMLTEQLAPLRGEHKTSSYYPQFLEDSNRVVSLMQSGTADPGMSTAINPFLQRAIVEEYVLPFEYMKLDKVHKISWTLNEKKPIVFEFNKAGQLVQFKEGEREIHIVNYKDGLPVSVTQDGKITHTFAYDKDKVAVKENYYLETYQLVDKVFLKTGKFNISKEDYENKQLRGEVRYTIKKDKDEACESFSRTDSEDKGSYCYSNTRCTLPLTLTSTYNHDKSVSTYTMNANNELVIERVLGYKTTKMVYKMENGLVRQMSYTKKRNNEDYSEPEVIDLKYEYFK